MIILASLLTFFASIVGTIGGFGVSTIMVPIFITFLPLTTTLLLVGIVHLFTDIWKVILFKKSVNIKLALSFGIPGLIASFIGAKLLLQIPEEVITKAIGFLLIGYVAAIFILPKFKLKENFKSTFIGGSIYGFIAGISGVGGPERSAFLLAFNLKKAVFVATSGLIGAMVDITRISTYLFDGVRLSDTEIFTIIILIPISFVGALTGKKLLAAVSQNTFRIIVAVMLLVIGVKLALSL